MAKMQDENWGDPDASNRNNHRTSQGEFRAIK